MSAKSYEAMFLLDPAMASDWSAAEAEVKRVLDRAEAKVLGMKKWDERKLAYPIGRNKRGLYVLTFFEASPEKIGPLERDCTLSEKVLRVLVLRRDRLTPEKVEKEMTAAPPPKPTTGRGDEWSGPPGGGYGGGPGGGRGRREHEDREAVAVAAAVDDGAGESGGADEKSEE